MDEKKFLRTMIETLKWDGDDYEEKEKMLSILRYAEIEFEKTTTFTRKHYQCYEDIAIRVRIPMLKDAKKLIQSFKKLVTYIYKETKEYDLGNVLIRPKFVEGQDIEIVEHSVAFEEIREEIIQGIRIAKYVIWVSVAWFTDKVIYEELLAKKKEGVQVRIITSDASNNNKLKAELISDFNALFVPGFGAYGNNLVHNKFCIVDFEFVMHGSYNWTYAAEYNDETWITSIDKELVAEFSEEFKKLYIKYI
ncbi:phospholipase D-like domain-containing protein [Bacillus cihuensis]|uniref:phospholipase D-like domain-containing protein n=1 Tax=Bacillus cihuensis TaxID=1208599 RepID=UPI000427A6E7|nr:phospholipase D-like domain-containing protein [Bacillus cihuensis]